MKKILKDKRAIISGLIFATLDFIILSGPLIYYCVSGSNRCFEQFGIMALHSPVYLLFQLISYQYPKIFFLVIAGVIQYFLLGYLFALMIIYLKKRK